MEEKETLGFGDKWLCRPHNMATFYTVMIFLSGLCNTILFSEKSISDLGLFFYIKISVTAGVTFYITQVVLEKITHDRETAVIITYLISFTITSVCMAFIPR